MRRSLKRLLVAVIPATALALVSAAAGASGASASPVAAEASQHLAARITPAHVPYPEYITGTVEASPVLNVRNTPNTSNPPIRSIPSGATIYIACYTIGQTVTATWGGQTWTTDVWDGLWDGSTGGFNGAYVSDAWVNTGGNTANFVAPCG